MLAVLNKSKTVDLLHTIFKSVTEYSSVPQMCTDICVSVRNVFAWEFSKFF